VNRQGVRDVPRRSDARPHAIRATSELLQRQGYAATGLEEVLAKSGAPKGSFYFHFPGGKEQLAAEAVAASGAFIRDILTSVVAQAATPGDAVRHFASLEARQLERSDYELGCPVATVTLEMASRSEALRLATHDAFASWSDVFRQTLEEAGVDASDAGGLAEWVIATSEGALILARASRDASIIMRMAERIARVVDDALPKDQRLR
jgi:TetR/AcrR family transcriptional repressor of lmrAB and yxaGH operons